MTAKKPRAKTKAARPATVPAYLASLPPKRLDMGKCCLHFKALDDLELTSVAKVIAMSTPEEYIAYYKRVKGLA